MTQTQIEIDAALTRRRRRAVLRAEEEDILSIGKRRPKKEPKITAGRQEPQSRRWVATARFNIPSPLTDRPRAADGASSFHFSYTAISKQSQPTLDDRPFAGRWSGGIAAAHARYIERDGAAEVVAHDAYIARPGAIEQTAEASVESRHIGQPSGSELLFSNISDDAFLREEYWRAVERCERSPAENSLGFDAAASPEWWASVATTDGHPTRILDHIAHIVDADPDQRSIIKARPLNVSANQAGATLKWAASQPGWNENDPPISFISGRGGRIQNRIVAELPHEIDAAGRAEIVAAFVKKIADRGAMYTAVVHASDAHNDRRNYHLHFIVHDRPAKWLADCDMWDFEVSESFVDLKRTSRIRWPHRQNKIAEFTQDRGPKSTVGFVETLRNEFAEISNEVLAKSGLSKRYDARTYTKMGIDRIPTEHLGPKAAALESVGVPTAVGTLNAVRIWMSAERQVDKQRDHRIAEARVETQRRASSYDGDPARRRELSVQLAARTAASSQVAELKHSLDLLDLLERKAQSRALKTRDTCLTHLADIENGRANRTTKRNASFIKRRFDAAQAHLDSLAKAFRGDALLIAGIGIDLKQAELRIVALDVALDAIAASQPTPAIKPFVRPAAVNVVAPKSVVIDQPSITNGLACLTSAPASPTLDVSDAGLKTATDPARDHPSRAPAITPTKVVTSPTNPTATGGQESAVQRPQECDATSAIERVSDPLRLAYFAELAGEHVARNRTRLLGLSPFGVVSGIRRQTAAIGDNDRNGAKTSSTDRLLPPAPHDNLGQKTSAHHGMLPPRTGTTRSGYQGPEERAALTDKPTARDASRTENEHISRAPSEGILDIEAELQKPITSTPSTDRPLPLDLGQTVPSAENSRQKNATLDKNARAEADARWDAVIVKILDKKHI